MVSLYVILLKVAVSKNLLTMLSEDLTAYSLQGTLDIQIWSGQSKVITGDRAGITREVEDDCGKEKKHTQQKWIFCAIQCCRPLTRTGLRNCPSPAASSFVNLEISFSSTVEVKSRVPKIWEICARWWITGGLLSSVFQGMKHGEPCYHSLSLRQVHVERVIWKKGYKVWGRRTGIDSKSSGEWQVNLEMHKNPSSDGVEERIGEDGKKCYWKR